MNLTRADVEEGAAHRQREEPQGSQGLYSPMSGASSMEGERLKSFMGCLNCISAAVIQLNTCILSPGSLLATGTCSSPAFSLAVGKLPIAGELLLVSCALLAL